LEDAIRGAASPSQSGDDGSTRLKSYAAQNGWQSSRNGSATARGFPNQVNVGNAVNVHICVANVVQQSRPEKGGDGRLLKLQALVYDILPTASAMLDYATGPEKLSANG